MDYQKGVEDAMELCLSELINAKSKDEAIKTIKGLLGIMKSNKFEHLRHKIGAV